VTEFPSEHLFSATFVPELQLHIEFQMCIFRLLIVLPLPFSVKGKLKISNFAYASWLATSMYSNIADINYHFVSQSA